MGVVENMKNMRLPLDQVTFWSSLIPSNDCEDLTSQAVDKLIRLMGENVCVEVPLFSSSSSSDTTTTSSDSLSSGKDCEEMCEIFGIDYLGHLPYDPSILSSCENGTNYLTSFSHEHDNDSPSSLSYSHLFYEEILNKIVERSNFGVMRCEEEEEEEEGKESTI